MEDAIFSDCAVYIPVPLAGGEQFFQALKAFLCFQENPVID